MTGKISDILVIFILLQTSLIVQGSETCDQKAEKAIQVQKCCSYPMLVKVETLKVILDDIGKTVDITSLKFHCIFASKLFEEIKLKDLDKAAFKAFFSTMVQDPEWLAVYENVANQCIDNLSKYEELYQKLFKVPKGECDVKYVAILDCIMGSAFMACPAKSFTNSTECKMTKSFLAECHENEKAMDIYFQKELKMQN